jgi:hypothetical protein
MSFRRSATALAGSLLTALVVAGTAAPALAAGTTQLPAPAGRGVYVGGGAIDKLDTFNAWSGQKANFVLDYLPRDTWADIESPTWFTSQWQQRDASLVLGVPMLLEGTTVTTLQAGAAGDYNSHFVKLAQTLVSTGYSSASLRVGWEMNGDWYKWSAVKDPTAWKAYFRNIVGALRSVPGQHFTIDWTINLGDSAMPAENAYPGDDVVDYVGVDAYDWKWGDSTITPSARWQWMLDQGHGLNWVSSFAAAHGKQITVPEWGLSPRAAMQNGGGGDDPDFVRSMFAWTAAHHTAYQCYYDVDTFRIDGGAYPNAGAAYQSAVAANAAPVSAPVTAPVTVVTKHTGPKKLTVRSNLRTVLHANGVWFADMTRRVLSF